MAMAEHDKPDRRDERYTEHVSFYDSFMKFAQYGTGVVILILVLMAIFLL
jgi:Bacterial aa3 type cytochrome c oxidase subunit IV